MPVTLRVDESALKKMARRLQSYITERDVRFTHVNALEGISRTLGYANINTLKAAIKSAEEPVDAFSAIVPVVDVGEPILINDVDENSLRSVLLQMLNTDPVLVSMAERTKLEGLLRGAMPGGVYGASMGGWYQTAVVLEAQADRQEDALKRLIACGLLMLETLNEVSAAANCLQNVLARDLFVGVPDHIETWREFCEEIAEAEFDDLQQIALSDVDEIWFVLSANEANRIWCGCTSGDRLEGRHMAFPVRMGRYFAEMPEDIQERMVVSDHPGPIVDAVRGKQIAVWNEKQIERWINGPQRKAGRPTLEAGAINFILSVEATAVGEFHKNDLWQLGYDGGPRLIIPDGGGCSDAFVAEWVADIISFIWGIKDQKALFA